MTAREALAHARAEIEAHPELRDGAARDAALLLLHALGATRADLLARPERILTPTEQHQYDAFVARRTRHEPVQYIIGQQEFYGLALHVTPSVLIPRPETEHLVEETLHALAGTGPQRIADVGTGSGAIAIALAAHLPQAQVTALDLSRAALAVAAENAARHGLAARIRFVESDLLAALQGGEALDAVVSNPPYVAEAERKTMPSEVRNYEPATALFAGQDGLDVYRRLVPQAHAALRPGGLLAMEIGHGQREAVAKLMNAWDELRFVDDLQGIPRVALARKR
jgi:release factor glutamine methyltransferase